MIATFVTVTASLLAALLTKSGSPDDLVVVMEVLNFPPVTGEPLIVDFVVRNESALEICTPPHSYIDGELGDFVLHAHRDGSYVSRSLSSGFCGVGHGPFAFKGKCAEGLGPGEALRGRGLSVLLAGVPKEVAPSGDTAPLGEGKYRLTGELFWGRWRLKTREIEMEIFPPERREDACASQLVDPVFAIFMSRRPTTGLDRDLTPAWSVKAILEQCPDSVHARLARSRLLVLQAQRLSNRYGLPNAEQEAVNRQKLDVVTRIDEHLRANPDDPLALDLMDGKVQLLRRLEDETGFRKAIDALKARYPESGRARRAEATWRQLHSNPGDTE